MNYHLDTEQTFRLGSIQNGKTNVFYATLSVDFHTTNTTALQTTARIYPEALLAGAGTLQREEFLEAIRSIGAALDISVGDGAITFTLRSRAERAAKLLSLFALMMEKPTFAPKELNRIRGKLHHELTELKEEARYLAECNLTNQLFLPTDRRYTATPEALQKHVAKVTKQDLQALHDTIRKAFWQATVGTDTKAVAQFLKTLKQLKADQPLAPLTPLHAPNQKPKPTVSINIPSKQNIEYSIGHTLPLTIHHPDYIPFIFGLAVLGKWGGFTGRLMRTVREKEGLTYGIYARSEGVTGSETGYWRIMTFFNPTDADRGLASTFREIALIAKDGITDDEYIRFKTILFTQQQLLADSYVRNIEDLHTYMTLGLSLEEMEALKTRLTTVTKAEVDRALATYLDVKQLVVSAAGPVKKAKKTAR